MKTCTDRRLHAADDGEQGVPRCFLRRVDGCDVNVVLRSEREDKKALRARRRVTAAKFAGGGLLLAVVTLTVFFSVLLNAFTQRTGDGATGGGYEYVLADIEGITEANPRIADIAMLGAHNAVTAHIGRDAPIDGAGKNSLLGKVLPVSRGLQYRYSVTQTVSVGTLLRQGVRYLHIKYAWHDGDWYGCHSLVGRKLEEDITEVLRFLDGIDGGEIVTLAMLPTYVGEGGGAGRFHEWLAGIEYNGRNIYDYIYYSAADYGKDSGRYLTYNDVTDCGEKPGLILIDLIDGANDFAVDGYDGGYEDKWNPIGINGEWYNTANEEKLIGLTEKQANKIMYGGEGVLYGNTMRINQAHAVFGAGSACEIAETLVKWSLIDFSEKFNDVMLDNGNFDKWLKAMPVFQVDYANSDHGDFNARVNEKIRVRNEEIVNILLQEGTTYEDLYNQARTD